MVVNTLQEALDECRLVAKGDKSRLLEGLSKLLKSRPEERYDLLTWTNEIQARFFAWFKLELADKFPPLSRELENLHVKLEIPEYVSHSYGSEERFGNVQVSIPMFAVVDFGNEYWRLKTSGRNNRRSDLEVELSAKTPAVPREVYAAFLDAGTATCNITAKGLQTAEIRAVLSDRFVGRIDCELPTADDVVYKVIWRPHPSEMRIDIESPRDRDPALVLEYAGQWFLVSQWDSEFELPFKHILKEYQMAKNELFGKE